MLKKTVEYTNLMGNQVKKTLFFNLTQTEAVEFAMELPDEVTKTVGEDPEVNVEAASLKLVQKLGSKGVFGFVKNLVLKSYGIPSEDGDSFVKNEKIREEFEHSLAFDTLFMELMQDDNAAAQFVNGVLPAKLAEKAAQVTAANPQPTLVQNN